MFVVKESVYNEIEYAIEDAQWLADNIVVDGQYRSRYIGRNVYGDFFITTQKPLRPVCKVEVTDKRKFPDCPVSRASRGHAIQGDELEYIRQNWGSLSSREIGRRLGRSDSAVRTHAKKMGLY